MNYSKEDVEVWKTLLTRLEPLVMQGACNEYIEGLEKLALPENYIPTISEMTEKLKNFTGWSLYEVDSLVPTRHFFKMLSQKKFPAIHTIRKKKEMDFYAKKDPDLFHEYYGHCPLLTNKKYADCMKIFGEYAHNLEESSLQILSKIFWATFEFGLIKNNTGLKIYGAGILPSKTETLKILSGKSLNLKKLDVFSTIDASLQGNITQSTYYYVENLDVLYDIIQVDLYRIFKLRKGFEFECK